MRLPPRRHIPELCFVVALAARDARFFFIPPLKKVKKDMKLKWPNDLLLDGAKLAGILIEAESVGGKAITAAGIGVNCTHHPDNVAYPATSLAGYGAVGHAGQL